MRDKKVDFKNWENVESHIKKVVNTQAKKKDFNKEAVLKEVTAYIKSNCIFDYRLYEGLIETAVCDSIKMFG